MFRWLVNAGFLALPIAATLGILLALQAHRQASGQAPLFAPTLDNKWVQKTYCQKSIGIHPDTKGQEFTLNPNQWGWKEGEPGFLCMNVTTFNNQTYASETTAPQFSIVWQYDQAVKQPVHAFPNIKVDGDLLPSKDVNAMDIDVSWTMRLDNATGASASTAELTAANVNSNVAIDMFLDNEKSHAVDSEKAKYEVMVWLGAVGNAAFAIGQDDGAVSTKTMNGTTFNLYVGQNSRKQQVLTWKAAENAPNFQGDIYPLVEELFKSNKPDYPSKTDYLGYFSFGSEAYHSTKPVSFSVKKLAIDIRKS